MIKRLFLYIVVSVNFLLILSQAQALENNKITFPQNTDSKPINKNANTSTETKDKETSQSKSIPEWLKRINYGIVIETDQKPRVYFETVQPLYQSLDKINTIFTHDRISIQNGMGAYSGGLGYRRLMFNENLLAGINTFFDYQAFHRHYRQGVGFEAITKTLEARANAYFGISPTRIISEGAGATDYEKVVNGGDVEIGGPLPYLPWIKIFGSYYRYDFKKSDAMQGWKARGELKPYKFIVINLETYDDNKGSQEYRMDTRFSLAVDSFSPKSILAALKPTCEPYPDTDLRQRTLDRVERNFNIQVEKWKVSGNTVIEIRRGD